MTIDQCDFASLCCIYVNALKLIAILSMSIEQLGQNLAAVHNNEIIIAREYDESLIINM